MNKWIASISGLVFILGLAGCNTMAGLGEDIEAGGQKLEKSAERKKSGS